MEDGVNNRRVKLYLDDATGVYGFDTSYGSGSPQFDIATLGTSRMRIDGPGNVGIGTASPAGLLHVNAGATPSLGQFRITANALGGLGGLVYSVDNVSMFTPITEPAYPAAIPFI